MLNKVQLKQRRQQEQMLRQQDEKKECKNLCMKRTLCTPLLICFRAELPERATLDQECAWRPRKITSKRCQFVRVARLQNEVGTKDFFEARIFSRKMLCNFPRNFWAFILWVQTNLAKFQPKFPANFPPKNQKNHRRAFAGAQGEQFVISCSRAHTWGVWGSAVTE